MTPAGTLTPGRPAETVAVGFSFLESPRWRDGSLFVSDFYTHRVLRFPDGRGTGELVCEVPDQPSGLAFTPDGEMLVVSMLDRTLRRWHSGELQVVTDLAPHVTGPPNDMVTDPAGRVWIGNFADDVAGTDTIAPAAVVTVSPTGEASIAAEGVNFPNGMAFTDGYTTLLIAETFAGRITAFDVEGDGTLTNRRVWAEFGGPGELWDIAEATRAQPVLPDGIALDSEGALWVADAKGHGAIRVAEGGDVLDRVDTGELAVYAVALGGPDGRDLYLCCSPPLGTNDPATSRDSVLMRSRTAAPAAVTS